MLCALALALPALLSFADPALKPTSKLRLTSGYGDCNQCTLRAQPATLTAGDWVHVTIEGISYGAPTDWIGAFDSDALTAEGAMLRFPVRWYAPAAPVEPPYARPRHVPPLRRQLASTTCWPRGSASPFPDRAASCTGAACCADNDYLKRGSATVSFLLSDVRATYVFALVQGDAQYPMLAAVSNAVAYGVPTQVPTPLDPAVRVPSPMRAVPPQPTGLHLALTTDSKSMRVTWTSKPSCHVDDTACLDDEKSRPAVRWGRAQGNFTLGSATANWRTYTRRQVRDRSPPPRPHISAADRGGLILCADVCLRRPRARHGLARARHDLDRRDDRSCTWRYVLVHGGV